MIASASVQTAADSTRGRLCVLCAAGFLCPLTENVYDVEFLAFKIRDAETGKVRAPRGPPATLSSRHRGNGSNGTRAGCRSISRWRSRSRTAPASTTRSWMTAAASSSTSSPPKCSL